MTRHPSRSPRPCSFPDPFPELAEVFGRTAEQLGDLFPDPGDLSERLAELFGQAPPDLGSLFREARPPRKRGRKLPPG